MTLRTYYPDQPQAPETEDDEPVRDTGDPHNIAYGYNVADIDRLARIAVSRSVTRFGSYLDRYEAAWTAISETLCLACEDPDPSDLIESGWKAVAAHAATEAHHHGVNPRAHDEAAKFIQYWMPHATPSPEHRVSETLALWQILPLLTRRQQQAVTALAATEDYQLAAAAVGVSMGTFHYHIQGARARFLRWWHQGETPSKIWRTDRRIGARNGQCRGRERITESALDTIRDRRHAGETARSIAADYGVHEDTVRNLLAGRSKPAPDPEEAT